MSEFLFTSESVSPGHPDKLADRISDAILDALLAQDSHARVACEVLVKSGMVLLAGEVTTEAWVDMEAIARRAIVDVGYDHADLGFDGRTCSVLTSIGKQSPDIAAGVDGHADGLGAGDQGLMFGFACDETHSFMPAPISYAHQLMRQQAQLRQQPGFEWIGPDAKCQVTLRYVDAKPVAIDCVVFSTQHAESASLADVHEAVMDHIIAPVLPSGWLKDTRFLINPTGRFVIGGPQADCGLTGRKIIVDTYGGMARHGGGAFSGKDPSKVDRSAAYAARYLAKHVVAAGLARRCEIQLSYAIGVIEPVALVVNTFGTGVMDDQRIARLCREAMDLSPQGIINHLQLKQPVYEQTAAFGHFGRCDEGFAWEQCDRLAMFQDELTRSSTTA